MAPRTARDDENSRRRLDRWTPYILAALTAIVSLNSATFVYVLSIERRITRLETLDEAAARDRARARAQVGGAVGGAFDAQAREKTP